MRYASVIVDIDISKLNKVFTYILPDNIDIKIGDCVNIPFGTAKKIRQGFVVEIFDKTNIDLNKLKYIDSLSDKRIGIEKSIIELANVISNRYGTNILTSLKAITPVKEIHDMRNKKNPLLNFSIRGESEKLNLTSKQKNIVDIVSKDIKLKNYKEYLLYAVTGSGKTLIYIELVKKALECGKKAVILIPEISLTYQTIERFYNVFGDEIAIMHSKLSNGEKYNQYKKVLDGKAKIVIGPRSALFMILSDIGIIIIDEENDSSYKSEKSPRFNIKDIARMIAENNKAVLLLGSATPSMESYYNAVNNKGITLLKLTSRPFNIGLPKITVVDLKKEEENGNTSLISNLLDEKIKDRLSKKEQILLLLNRRGYSSYVSCVRCGHVIKCRHCDVSMTYHKNENLVCHYCGSTIKMPKKCPNCGSENIGRFMFGTEQIEEIVKDRYKNARVLRMDKDTTSRKNTADKIISNFYNNEADILLGTQMIAKGHHFPNVTLVGSLNSDLTLNLEDYNSAKMTFDLLTQASGRAGRSNKKGEVIIQTYNPDNFVFECVKNNDFESFYKEEIMYRNALNYPPSSNMLMIMLTCKNEEKLAVAINYVVKQIQRFKRDLDMEILGPSVPRIEKIKDLYRRVVYIKCKNYDILIRLRKYIEEYMRINKGFNNIFMISEII